ncbi:hypothetical protein Back11_34360 [Paenibacillus baekrokdamisoli]|uniref:Uncharacterized protein n=1 Tax=Paenibacillus baekrokdamisoli TaxID=1712516 RepID=A0A3G9J8F5_9BACL|nr:hypothetical protein Back11_34360 [Paenibacillus baekrokdamisoli]
MTNYYLWLSKDNSRIELFLSRITEERIDTVDIAKGGSKIVIHAKV